MPRIVFFDAFNTLFRLKDSVANLYIKQLKALARDCPLPTTEAVSASFRTAFKKNNALYPLFGRNLDGGYHRWWEIIVTESLSGAGVPTNVLQQSNDRNETIPTQIVDYFATTGPFEVNPSAERILESLKRQQFNVGVITNSDPRTEKILEALALRKWIDLVVTSYEAGCEKPDPRIFEIALQRASILTKEILRPSDALYIGDDRLRDYDAPQTCGWNAQLLTEWGKLQETVQYGLQVRDVISK
ncbi:hypothetical protein HDU99_010339 [Rhizoclosmatium hyalinum]|nr:hypothetical protein HDU99_010339 [Rhizoclosmatium hyalinum]